MKRIITILLIITIIGALASCGKSENDKNDKKNNTPSTTKDVTSTKPEVKEGEKPNTAPSDGKVKSETYLEQLPNTYKISGREIYMNVPNYQEIEEGYTRLFIVHGKKYVAVTCNKNVKPKTLEEAHKEAFDKLKQNMQNYVYPQKINATKEENKTINGIEVYRYEGTATCTGDQGVYEAYIVGYSFIMDGLPCNISGCVLDESQSKEMIDEIRSNVDAMIETVRTVE